MYRVQISGNEGDCKSNSITSQVAGVLASLTTCIGPSPPSPPKPSWAERSTCQFPSFHCPSSLNPTSQVIAMTAVPLFCIHISGYTMAQRFRNIFLTCFFLVLPHTVHVVWSWFKTVWFGNREILGWILLHEVFYHAVL